MIKKEILQKKIHILGYVIKVNKAWYFSLLVGVLVNLYLNFVNRQENIELNAITQKQTAIISQLRLENKDLKNAMEALLENMVDVNRSFEDFDLEVFNKVKKRNSYISNYYNPAYESAHFTPQGSNRYENMGRTDYNNAPEWMAKIWHKSDSVVAVTGISGVFAEPYFHPETKKITWGNFYKWRKIPNNDTLVYGLKLPKYKITK